MFKLWASDEMVSMKVLQGNKAECSEMQDDSQAFHTEWKALLQSVTQSFAASMYSQYRQIPHMAGYSVYMNTATLSTQAASASITFFFSLHFGLCSPTEFYKTGSESRSILKMHSSHKIPE